jgi:hypothetical protein
MLKKFDSRELVDNPACCDCEYCMHIIADDIDYSFFEPMDAFYCMYGAGLQNINYVQRQLAAKGFNKHAYTVKLVRIMKLDEDDPDMLNRCPRRVKPNQCCQYFSQCRKKKEM